MTNDLSFTDGQEDAPNGLMAYRVAQPVYRLSLAHMLAQLASGADRTRVEW